MSCCTSSSRILELSCLKENLALACSSERFCQLVHCQLWDNLAVQASGILEAYTRKWVPYTATVHERQQLAARHPFRVEVGVPFLLLLLGRPLVIHCVVCRQLIQLVLLQTSGC